MKMKKSANNLFQSPEMREEFYRKLIHLASLAVPVLYFYAEKKILLGLISLGLVIAFIVEWQRRKQTVFSGWFDKWLGRLLRPSERSGLTSATMLIIGSFFTILLFQKEAAVFSLFILSVADAMAALVGKSLGRHKLLGRKTWEGSFVFFCCTVLLALCLLNLSFLPLLILCVTLTTAELILPNSLDNLALPMISGALVILLYTIF